MDTVTIPKDIFSKILDDVEILIDDVEIALDNTVKRRINELESGKIKAKTEKELDEYLQKRGIKVD